MNSNPTTAKVRETPINGVESNQFARAENTSAAMMAVVAILADGAVMNWVGTTLLCLAMDEDQKGYCANHKCDSGVGPRQTVPAEQSERHGSDVAASFAKPPRAQVTPSA